MRLTSPTLLPAVLLLVAILAFTFAPQTAHAAPRACVEGTQPSGALYRICLPDIPWNGKLVLYAHGYVAPTEPLKLPDDELAPGGASIVDLLTTLGYAFATTSYRTNGLAIPLAVADLVELAQLFSEKHGAPDATILVGASEGGAITVLALERQPNVFDGGLALCGPYGDFTLQVNYIGDFRVLFDYFFPGLVPPTPVDIPDNLLDTWERETYSTTVKPVVTDPANAAALDQLLKVAGVPYDPDDPATKEQGVARLLWYNIYGADNARERLGGQPFDNQQRIYSGSTDDATLNATVQRFTADQAALTTIAAQYQTTGRLRVPLVTLHTSGDPIVPVRHSLLYRDKVVAAGSGAWLEQQTFADRYGHCTFSALQLLDAFDRTVELVETPRIRTAYLPQIAN
jgi:pimeloyl-ACP methyl ester carboxylesterase